MTTVSSRMHLSKLFVLMIYITSMISNGRARARSDFKEPKGWVKTIKSHKTGEVINCVDIFKQPAFDHPLLKNHTLQMKSSSNLKATGAGYVQGALNQAWWKYGDCPEGTIPIARPQNYTNRPVKRLTPHVRRLDESQAEITPVPGHEYALVFLINGKYMGAHAYINVWNPTVADLEFSSSQLWLASGPAEEINSVHAGWTVNANTYHRNQAQFFIYWKSDKHQKTGCYNLECPGFVQTNSKIALGSLLGPVSNYGGEQYGISLNIRKNDVTGDWWLRYEDVDLGYWPREIFTSLGGPADTVSWGGEILNEEPNGRHTPTQMGSGYFPSEGYGKASLFTNLKFVDDAFIERDPKNLVTHATRPECYDLMLKDDPFSSYGVHFYYGGPGFSDKCAQ